MLTKSSFNFAILAGIAMFIVDVIIAVLFIDNPTLLVVFVLIVNFLLGLFFLSRIAPEDKLLKFVSILGLNQLVLLGLILSIDINNFSLINYLLILAVYCAYISIDWIMQIRKHASILHMSLMLMVHIFLLTNVLSIGYSRNSIAAIPTFILALAGYYGITYLWAAKMKLGIKKELLITTMLFASNLVLMSNYLVIYALPIINLKASSVALLLSVMGYGIYSYLYHTDRRSITKQLKTEYLIITVTLSILILISNQWRL